MLADQAMAALASRGHRMYGSDVRTEGVAIGLEERKCVEDTDLPAMLARIEEELRVCFEEWERNMNEVILWNDRALAAIMDA